MLFSDQAKKKAIAYYRHSAEDKQENSVPIQREHAQKFAQQHQIEIIHEEADEGKSGLQASRPGFEKLFNEWILNPDAPAFDYVLVYDVSRWGRFQDQDEAAYYEFRCKQSNKKVIYVARGFPKEEQQLISHLQTSIERYMAAEYSRQLSDKVFYGCVKVSEQGFSAGGTACYGMSRVLLDENKKPIRPLKRGEHKVISNQRVSFTPANDQSTETVRKIFELLVNKWRTPNEIAGALNAAGSRSANGGLWNREKVLKILTNETYAGTRIYNKTWGRLKQKIRPNPRNEWVIQPNAFPAIVEDSLFSEAQEHLYWLMPTKWKRGIYTISRIQKLIQTEIRVLLADQDNPENIEAILENFPVVFGARFYRESTPHWCFLIDEGARNFDNVLAVSVAIDQRDPIDGFFLIPTDAFNSSNFIIFSQDEKCYAEYKTPKEKISEEIIGLRNKFAPQMLA